MNRLGLGTAQFGLDYGVSNAAGQLSRNTVREILEAAERQGIDLLDTAHLYGDAESILGETLTQETWRLVTKTPQMAGGLPIDALVMAFKQSLEHLNVKRVYGLLAHDANDLLCPAGPAIWSAMQELRDSGRVLHIGASIYDGDQIDALMEHYPLDLVQLPFNILDDRLIEGGQLERLAVAGVEIHARSVFLQGLLLMPPSELPPNLLDVGPHLSMVHARLAEAGLTPLEGALAGAMTRPEIDTVIVGVTSPRELNAVARAAETVTLRAPDLPFREFAIEDVTLLNPQHWGERNCPPVQN